MEPLPTIFESRFLLSIEDSEAGKKKSKYLQSENQFLKLFCFFGARAYILQLAPQKIWHESEPENHREEKQRNWTTANFQIINFPRKRTNIHVDFLRELSDF